MRYRAQSPAPLRAFFKRLFDLLLSAPILVVAMPLLLLLALLIKLDSDGPVLFRQRRLGQHGNLFLIWKFRTMVNGAETIGAGLHTFKGDPRVTRLGKIIRNYRLDELPQLFNVLGGHMSLVGPRPLLPEYLYAWSARDRQRLMVKPGMTGWQQVNGGSLNTWDERINLDLWYAQSWNLWIDLLVLLRTIGVVFSTDTVHGRDGWQRSGCPDRVEKSIKEVSQLG